MSIVLTDDTYYQDIANAIRSKNGTTTQYKPSEMAAAINAISTGGGDIGLSNINSSITYPLHIITSIDSNSNPIYDSSVDVSGYTLYFPADNNGYPELSNGTNTITYDATSLTFSSFTGANGGGIVVGAFKLNGLAQEMIIIRFVIGGDYATEHSSTSYNLYNLMLGPTHSATTSLFQWPPRLSIINGPTTKEFFNPYGTVSGIRGSSFRHAIRYHNGIGRHILYIYYPHKNRTTIWPNYDNGIFIPIISELYSA